MAMTLTTVRNTNQETVIHFESTAAESGTITIANLTATTQARNSDTPTVNIVKFLATGEDTAILKIVRNSKNVISCAPENAPFLDFNANGITVTNDNTYDIVITNAAAKAVTGWLVLRKVAGWSTKVETAVFGPFDNQSAVGS